MSETLERPADLRDQTAPTVDAMPDPKTTLATTGGYVDDSRWDAPPKVAKALGVPVDKNGFAQPTAVPGASTTKPTGVDAQIRAGEGMGQDPHSSAYSGFLDETWLEWFPRIHPELTSGKTKEEILAFRRYPEYVNQTTAAYNNGSKHVLEADGLPVTDGNVKTLFRLGVGDGPLVIKTAQTNPDALMRDVVPGIFRQNGNMDIHDMTVGQFLANPYPGGSGSAQEKLARTAAEGYAIVSGMGEQLSADKARIARLAKGYKPFEPTEPPQQPVNDPLQAFGGVASIFAMLAAGISKTPAIAAMNGLAGAIQGAREKDWTAYQTNYKTWKDSNEFALKAHENYSRDLKDALDMLSTNYNAGAAMLKAVTAQAQDEQAMRWAAEDRPDLIKKRNADADKAAAETRLLRDAADTDVQYRAAESAHDAAVEAGDPALIAKTEEEMKVKKRARDQALKVYQDIKAAGYAGRASGQMDAQKLKLYEEGVQSHPEWSAEEKAAFFNQVMGREDPAAKTALRTREQERKERKDALDAEHKTRMGDIAADKSVSTTERNLRLDNERERHNKALESIGEHRATTADLAIESRERIAERTAELKEAHETNWREINEDRTKTQREIADARITEAAKWHAAQADLSVRKLDQSASIADRKENELERHNKRRELIDSDWHLTLSEKDRLKRDEDIRWHDMQNERGWGGIESRERTAEQRETALKEHRERLADIAADKNMTIAERNQRLDAERERHDKAIEAIGERKATTGEITQIERGRHNLETERVAIERWQKKQSDDLGSLKSERADRFRQAQKAMPEGMPVDKIWDEVDRQQVLAKSPKISPAAARNVAEQVVAGNLGALSGFGRNPAMLAQIENEIAVVAAEKGMTGGDIVRVKAEYAAYTKALKDFATGKQGQIAQSMNVATQHLGLLGEAATALAQNDSQTINRLQNAFQNEFGWTEPITFNAIKTIVGSEIEKAVTGSAGALEDRRELREGLAAQSTPEQLRSVIEGYKGLMAGQLQGLEKTYERTTKRTDFRDEFLLPEARREMERIAPRGGSAPTDAAHPPVPAPLTGKTGLQWNPTRKQWRDTSGKIYNANGAEVR